MVIDLGDGAISTKRVKRYRDDHEDLGNVNPKVLTDDEDYLLDRALDLSVL
jgi:hypothetical protein